jgi:hypothetical protein
VIPLKIAEKPKQSLGDISFYFDKIQLPPVDKRLLEVGIFEV